MQFTGSQLFRKRNFYTQNGNFGVAVDFSVDNPTGRYEFGLSGTNLLSITLESGQIKYNNLFIQSYLPFNDYSVLLEVTDNNLNYIQNDNEVAYGLSKDTGNYNYFYFKRDNAGINAEFDFYLSGKNLPNYSIDKFGYWLNTGQQEVTGNFTNQSGYEIGIFNSVSQGLQNLSYSFSSGFFSSGQMSKFRYGGDLSQFDFSQPITTIFNTNFGTLDINFRIIDTSTLSKFILLDEIADFSFNINNEINRELFYTNYSGGAITDLFNTDIFFKLDYIDGSGMFEIDDFADSAHFTANAYGNINERGFLTGQVAIPTGNNNVTGLYTINFESFQWATGRATGFFSGQSTGMASGAGYTGIGYASFTGLATGLIYDGSGSLLFLNQLLTGHPIDPILSVDYSGYINATGFLSISGISNGTVFFIGTESLPLVKGLQFSNETGLVYYLSGASDHKVNSYYDGSVIKLYSLLSGAAGNDIFVMNNDCNLTPITNYTPYLIGGQNLGATGLTIFSMGGPFSGFVDAVITGSGNYASSVTDNLPGIFTFERTFTGAWDIYTGLSQGTLSKIAENNSDFISGRAILEPNSSIIFQINHQDSDINIETVKLTISGQDILNPISTIISQ